MEQEKRNLMCAGCHQPLDLIWEEAFGEMWHCRICDKTVDNPSSEDEILGDKTK